MTGVVACGDDGGCGIRGMTIFIPVIPENTQYSSGISQTVWLRLNGFVRRSPLRSMRG